MKFRPIIDGREVVMEIPVEAVECAMLTRDDMMARFDINPSTLSDWMRTRKLPYIKIGGVVRFVKYEIDNWVDTFKQNNPHLRIRSF
jgi:predicted DNA-binding transcriptional regulator AlpA